MLTLTLNDLISASEDQVSCDLDGRKVLLSIQDNMYYSMNPIASIIWDHLIEPCAVEKLVHEIYSRFDTDKQQCQTDVIDFLNSLHKESLISIHQQ